MPTAGRREAKLPHRQRLWEARFFKHGLSRRQRRWRVGTDTAILFFAPLRCDAFFQGQVSVGKLLGRHALPNHRASAQHDMVCLGHPKSCKKLP